MYFFHPSICSICLINSKLNGFFICIPVLPMCHRLYRIRGKTNLILSIRKFSASCYSSRLVPSINVAPNINKIPPTPSEIIVNIDFFRFLSEFEFLQSRMGLSFLLKFFLSPFFPVFRSSPGIILPPLLERSQTQALQVSE